MAEPPPTPRSRRKLPPTPRTALEHRFARAAGRAIDVQRLTREQARALRDAPEGAITCLSCPAGMELTPAASGGICFRHRDPAAALDHDPESEAHRRAVRAVAERLGRLFPSAQMEDNVDFPRIGYLADLVVVSPRGLKLAAEVLTSEISAARYREISAGLSSEGVAMLWLLGLDLLSATGAASRTVRKVKLGPLHTALLATGRSLMFIDPGAQKPFRRPEIVLVRPHPLALRLAQLGEPELGSTECMMRRYPLSQLRLQAGEVCLLTDYDPPAPPPGDLPKRLATKLARREGQGRLG